MTEGETRLRLERILVYCLQKDPTLGDLFQDYLGGGCPYERLRGKC